MRVYLVTPDSGQTHTGNRTSAQRWARILRDLSHRVRVTASWEGEPVDLLVALHAKKSHRSIARFRRAHPDRPIVLALTGTDLYRDLARSKRALRSVEIAQRLITLQPLAQRELPRSHRSKVRVIYQSVLPLRSTASALTRSFDVCVVAHLRLLKDPFRAALAARRLPDDSRVRILHAGAALNPDLSPRAEAEQQRNPRYRWLGQLPRGRLLRLLARCKLTIVASRMEGGANIVGESIVAGVPILASRIPGNIGLLGQRYPGYFEPGNTVELTRLLQRAETDQEFWRLLRKAVLARRSLFHPRDERRAWKALLAELASD
jgi:putative glycosyltransferase (TIGR04348 family)